MKTRLILFPSILAALALLSGCVTSRTPVGTKVAALKSEVWNGKWKGDDGGTARTRIKDARLGIVQITTKSSWFKPSETHELLVRTLGPLTIANQRIGNQYWFGRVAADSNHLLCFQADESIFESLIKQREIAGIIERDKRGKSTGNCTIDGFSEKDCERLEKEGFDLRSLFEEDPTTVLIRYKWMPLW